jgi:hypothetical protein
LLTSDVTCTLKAGNAVIFLTSINNSLDLRNTFYWGRTTLDSCPGSDSRLPTTAGCQDVEGVFLERMGLTWKDAVALLGAHTLGRGQKQVRNETLVRVMYGLFVFSTIQYLAIHVVLRTPWNMGSQ